MAKIIAPNRAYTGTGAAGVQFVNGEAESNDPAALAYFRRAGYQVSGKAPKGFGDFPTVASTEAPSDHFEPEIPAQVKVGTPLRDAAVDPIPGKDFLPPTNAGKADPHGPSVVSPQIHADGPKGIKPGDVHVGDPDEQAKDETALAAAVLVEGQDVGAAMAAAAPPPEAPAQPAAPAVAAAPSKPRGPRSSKRKA